MLEAYNEAIEQNERDEEDQDTHSPGGERSPKSSKFARAHAKTYRTGPPLVPSIIVDNIVEYIGKVTVRKKAQFVLSVCKYWSLKREARRGAPLLKRLHLEVSAARPWFTFVLTYQAAMDYVKQQTADGRREEAQTGGNVVHLSALSLS